MTNCIVRADSLRYLILLVEVGLYVELVVNRSTSKRDTHTPCFDGKASVVFPAENDRKPVENDIKIDCNHIGRIQGITN